MPRIPFRFLHASDFHLEQPLGGLSMVPDHLRKLLINAPYVAAERVFDTAMQEDVDFVVLSGDILDCRTAGPHAVEFVRRQFQRLSRRPIAVYWSGSRIDQPSRWPESVPLPKNVHRFAPGDVTGLTHHRGEQPLANVIGKSNRNHKIRSADFAVESSEPLTVAVVHGSADKKSLLRGEVDYWALGGEHSAATLFSSDTVAQYCGSPQGRNGEEEGPHGCTLVSVSEEGKIHSRMVPTDVVRWCSDSIEITPGMSAQDLEHVLRDRTRDLRDAALERQVLVSWSVTHEAPTPDTRGDQLTAKLRQGRLAHEIVERLRHEFGMSTPGVWTVDLEVVPPAELPSAWYEEDTLLGDLLRLVRQYQENDDQPLPDLDAYLPAEGVTPELQEALKISNRHQREDILRRVAVLGVDLLRGDRILSGQ